VPCSEAPNGVTFYRPDQPDKRYWRGALCVGCRVQQVEGRWQHMHYLPPVHFDNNTPVVIVKET